MAEITEVITVDAGPVTRFYDGVADALDSFGNLSDAELAALPQAAQDGIEALRRACEAGLSSKSAASSRVLFKDMQSAYLSQASRNLQTGLELPGHGG